MAERPKAVVLKTTERKLRGFESLSLRHTFMRADLVEYTHIAQPF